MEGGRLDSAHARWSFVSRLPTFALVALDRIAHLSAIGRALFSSRAVFPMAPRSVDRRAGPAKNSVRSSHL